MPRFLQEIVHDITESPRIMILKGTKIIRAQNKKKNFNGALDVITDYPLSFRNTLILKTLMCF